MNSHQKKETTMKKAFLGLFALVGAVTTLASTAHAGNYNGCTVSDVQFVRTGSGPYFVFKAACSNGTYYWYAPNDNASANQQVVSLITTATTSNRHVDVSCGANGAGCVNFTANVFSGGVMSSQTIWNADDVGLE
jgi:hypothetical protein